MSRLHSPALSSCVRPPPPPPRPLCHSTHARHALYPSHHLPLLPACVHALPFPLYMRYLFLTRVSAVHGSTGHSFFYMLYIMHDSEKLQKCVGRQCGQMVLTGTFLHLTVMVIEELGV